MQNATSWRGGFPRCFLPAVDMTSLAIKPYDNEKSSTCNAIRGGELRGLCSSEYERVAYAREKIVIFIRAYSSSMQQPIRVWAA